jgi:hypothetical protein
MLTNEHFAGSAEAIRDLIQNQQRSVSIARSSNNLPVLRRWNVRSTAHGFRDHCADISLFVQNIFNISGALEGTLFPAIPGTVDGIRWWHVFSARKERADTGPKKCFTSDRNCVKRCTME